MEDSGSLLVVIPTYNEGENVVALIERLEKVRREHQFDVLVVDDGSPDGTGALVAEHCRSRSWLHLVERDGKRGLGSAYRAGFRWARDRGYSRVGEMDADLSHDPARIRDLDQAVIQGADLALGSRYVPGGGSEGWPLKRRTLSRSANRFARSLLRLRTKDVTGGFRVYTGRAIDLLLSQGTECDGYGFQIESVVALTRSGMNIREVPIIFREREFGRSKMTKSIMVEATRRCFQLAFTSGSLGSIDPQPEAATQLTSRSSG